MRTWIEGARPRTLPAAVVPVAVGTGVAIAGDGAAAGRMLLALVVAVAIQVGTNYANDYSDGVRGTDRQRVGPVRLVASGLASPARVRAAALAAFAVAAVAGLVLAAMTTWWLLVVGGASLAAGWFYTGGPRPYGYAGYGEVFVFVFFGLVATVGTTYVQLEGIPAITWFVAVPVGLLSTALLVVNNLRDIPTDADADKRTLAVRLGDEGTRLLFEGLVYVAVGWTALVASAFFEPVLLVPLLAVPSAARLAGMVRGGAKGLDLVPVLVGTGRLQLLYGALLAASVALS